MGICGEYFIMNGTLKENLSPNKQFTYLCSNNNHKNTNKKTYFTKMQQKQ